ncbi:DUF6705 family protein, partial [Lacinutrix salivirga]
MKHIIIIVTLFLSVTSTLEAQNINDSFVGIWETQNGDEIFRIELFIDNEGDISGHFSKVETTNSGLEILVYESNRPIGAGFRWGRAIYGSSDGTILEAGIDDNTVDNPLNLPLFSGHLTMTIQPATGSGQVTATWKVERSSGLKSNADNREFNIPTDIILTKV